jgi:hypothetical protein
LLVANKIGDEKSSMRGFTSFLEVLWSCSAIDEGKVLLDVVGLMGEADRAGLVRYAIFSANLRVFLLTD